MRFLLFCTSAALLAGPAAPAGAQQLPPIRPLGAITATSAESLRNVATVRALPGGGVLVNDVGARRLLLLDSTLAVAGVIADTTSGAANGYGARPAGLIPFRGDSSLFVDAGSMSMLVVDPAGRIARVMSVPRAQDAGMLASVNFGAPGLDAAGRLVYRASPRFQMAAGGAGGRASGGFTPPVIPDSAPLVRVDLTTRQVDTITWVKTPRTSMQVTQGDDGRITMRSRVNPLPVVDDWTVLSDGTVAIVRGRDYRVQFVAADGSISEPARIPFEWRRLSDEDKAAFIDSVKAARERMGASGQISISTGPGGPPGGGGGGGDVMIFRSGPGDGPGGPGGPGGGPGARGGGMMGQLEFVDPSELPDYRPAFFAGAARADAEGNLWIRTTAAGPAGSGPVYDVVNRRGELVERVQLPAGRAIVGFGAGGAVYLVARGENGVTLERARVR